MKRTLISSLLLIFLPFTVFCQDCYRFWRDGALSQNDFAQKMDNSSMGELRWGIVLDKKVAKKGLLRIHYQTSSTYMDSCNSWISPDSWTEGVGEFFQTGFDWLEFNRRKAENAYYKTPGISLYQIKSEVRSAMEAYCRDCNDGQNPIAISAFREVIDRQRASMDLDPDSLFSLPQRFLEQESPWGLFVGVNTEWTGVFPNGLTFIPLLTLGINWQCKALWLGFEAEANVGTQRSKNVMYYDSELMYEWDNNKTFGATGWCFRGGYYVWKNGNLSIAPFAGIKRESFFQYTNFTKDSGMESSWINGLGGQVGIAFKRKIRQDYFMFPSNNSLFETDLTITVFGDRMSFKEIGSVWSVNIGLSVNIWDYVSFL